MIDLHRQRDDAKSKAQAAAKQANPVECQPSASAPLLRDEKARRDWVERELEFCCQVWPLSCRELQLCCLERAVFVEHGIPMPSLC